jgi:hypothetical protein
MSVYRVPPRTPTQPSLTRYSRGPTSFASSLTASVDGPDWSVSRRYAMVRGRLRHEPIEPDGSVDGSDTVRDAG